MKKIINNNPTGYNEIRNIITEDNDFVYKKDIFSYGLKVMHKITGKGYHSFWKGLYYNPLDAKTPCHFFNTINLGSNPCKVYFETRIPRLANAPKLLYDIATKKMASDNCKEIIALSQCAYNIQLDYIEKNYPKYLEVIKRKLSVKLPPQKLFIKDYTEKLLDNNRLIFTIVGSDFFRKGGLEALKVFEVLIPSNNELFLNIVSTMDFGDYATKTTESDLELAQKIIAKFPNNIKQYKRLKNDDVLELFKKSHVGLLPTWADSFGYSTLEAQACGCPVITTDIRALPEINNNEIGWVIKVPKNSNKDGILETESDRNEFSNIIVNELKNIIIEILSDKKQIEVKGLKVIQNIIQNHSRNN